MKDDLYRRQEKCIIYISILHLYFQENCKADTAKLVEIGDYREDLFLFDGPITGILVFLLMCKSQVKIYNNIYIYINFNIVFQ